MSLVEATKIETIKCLLIGDDQIGKSSLLQTLATGKFPLDFVPEYYEKCSFYVDLADIKENLNSNSNGLVIEMSDHEDSLNLNDFNVVLLCFSFDNNNSFESLKTKWLNIVQSFNKNLSKNSDKNLSYILVGLKNDLADETTANFQRQSSVRRSKKVKIHPNIEKIEKSDSYEKYAKKIGACDFIELSAKEIGGLKIEEFDDKLNGLLEIIYKSFFFSNIDALKRNKKFKNLFNNSSYSRLQSPLILQNSTKQENQVKSVKFKFVNLLRQCKKYVFSCTSSRYTTDDNYENLDRPTNKLRNSKIKFPRVGKMVKLVNAESTVTLNIDCDEVFN
jgi:GTPase SAR1 family protein